MNTRIAVSSRPALFILLGLALLLGTWASSSQSESSQTTPPVSVVQEQSTPLSAGQRAFRDEPGFLRKRGLRRAAGIFRLDKPRIHGLQSLGDTLL